MFLPAELLDDVGFVVVGEPLDDDIAFFVADELETIPAATHPSVD